MSNRKKLNKEPTHKTILLFWTHRAFSESKSSSLIINHAVVNRAHGKYLAIKIVAWAHGSPVRGANI